MLKKKKKTDLQWIDSNGLTNAVKLVENTFFAAGRHDVVHMGPITLLLARIRPARGSGPCQIGCRTSAAWLSLTASRDKLIIHGPADEVSRSHLLYLAHPPPSHPNFVPEGLML